MSTTPASPSSQAIRIFFSYAATAPKDKRLFERLINHLSLMRQRYSIHEWYDSAISLGNDIAQTIEQFLNNADIIVLLISADFFASPRCYELEMKRALELSEMGAVHLVPVLLGTTDLDISPLTKYHLLPPDGRPVSSWRNPDDALADVAKGIRKVVDEVISRTTRAFTHSMPPQPPASMIDLPYRYNSLFTDREQILDTLTTAFTSAQPSQTSILALNGMSGMGKTQIATEYIRRFEGTYTHILWFNASSHATLSMEIRALVERLALPQQEAENEQQLFDLLKRWLQTQPRWLLVLDRLEDVSLVRLLVPEQSAGHVLLTTHIQTLGDLAPAIHITSMSIDDSALFLLRRANILSESASLDQLPESVLDDARAIVEEMGGFPLALDQAGVYIRETGCRLTTYLDSYRDERATLLATRGPIFDSRDHPESALYTLTLAIEQVTRKQSENLALLRLFAFLYADDIPLELLEDSTPVWRNIARGLATRPLNLHQAIQDLCDFSLVYHGTDRRVLYTHRIVQDVLKDALPRQQQRRWASLVVRMVESVFPQVRFDTKDRCERLLFQARHCASLIREYRLTLKEGASLLERLGNYCYRQACYSEADEHLTLAVELYEHNSRANLKDLAQTLNTLALLREQQARYDEALALLQRSLALREQELGAEHPKVAESLHNLAMVYEGQEDYQQAEALYRRALAIEERAKGFEHVDVASTLNNLGQVCYQQGRHDEAEQAYRRAFGIYERAPEVDRPNRMYPLDGLGALAEAQGDLQRAENLYRDAFAICVQTFGERHPETAQCLNKLAYVARERGDLQRAETLYREALDIAQEMLGPDHPDTTHLLASLARLKDKQKEQTQPLDERQQNEHGEAG